MARVLVAIRVDSKFDNRRMMISMPRLKPVSDSDVATELETIKKSLARDIEAQTQKLASTFGVDVNQK
jgi:hypothetical protein